MMAKCIGGETVEITSSPVFMLSHPRVVADLIIAAAT